MKNSAILFGGLILLAATQVKAQNTTSQELNAQPPAVVMELTTQNSLTHQIGESETNGTTNSYVGEQPQSKQQRIYNLTDEYPQSVEMQILPGSAPSVFIVRAPNNEKIIDVQVLDFNGTPIPVRIGNLLNKPQDKELDMGFETGVPRHIVVKTEQGIYTKQLVLTR